MKAISQGLGSGDVKQVTLAEVIDEDWAETLTLDLKMAPSKEFMNLASEWHCSKGIVE